MWHKKTLELGFPSRGVQMGCMQYAVQSKLPLKFVKLCVTLHNDALLCPLYRDLLSLNKLKHPNIRSGGCKHTYIIQLLLPLRKSTDILSYFCCCYSVKWWAGKKAAKTDLGLRVLKVLYCIRHSSSSTNRHIFNSQNLSVVCFWCK